MTQKEFSLEEHYKRLTKEEKYQLAYMEGYLGANKSYPRDSKLEGHFLDGGLAKNYHDWVEERYKSGFWVPDYEKTATKIG